MAIGAGTRLGPYEIVSALGAGGMGEVYRARDSRLNRDVALKVLPDAFAADPDRLARFEREAQLLATLNHPHIGAIYGIVDGGSAGAFPSPDPPHALVLERALVLELVEGATLADRIARGPMPIDEALAVARQVALALEAAHEVGIVHRDLKPANIKVRPDGTVKVLDFGLAKALGPPDGGPHGGEGVGAGFGRPDVSASPTITSPALMTGVGMILGTAAYMSPEQARGKPVDARADVWAFGCLCFEMLTGARAFPGEDVTQTIAAVIRGEPDWRLLPADLSPSLRVFLQRALEKDARQRVQHAGDLRLALDGAFDLPVAPGPAVVNALRWRAPLLAALAAALVVGGSAAALLRARDDSTPAGPIRFGINVSQVQPAAAAIAISRDGRSIAFVAQGTSASRTLWVRNVGGTDLRELSAVRLPLSIAWSPDGRQIAFTADGGLLLVDVQSGAIRPVLRDVPGTLTSGIAWDGADLVVATADESGTGGALLLVPSAGGAPRTVVSTSTDVLTEPVFVEAGAALIYLSQESGGLRQVCAADRDGGRRGCTPLDATTLAYPGTGDLLFGRGTTLFAQPFDPGRVEFSGVPVSLIDEIAVTATGRHWWAAAAAPGAPLLAYLPGSVAGEFQFTWFDRRGRPVGTLGDGASWGGFELSPNGRYLVATAGGAAGRSAYVLDVQRGTVTRASAVDRQAGDVVWAPDGRRLAYNAVGSGRIIEQPAFGGAERTVLEHAGILGVEDWSADGRLIAVLLRDGDVRKMTLVPAEGGAPIVVAEGAAYHDEFRFSPDGRWLAYNSDESGRQEVYVTPLPPTGERWPVSTGGGVQPRWHASGRELFYFALDGTLMAVPMGAGAPPSVGAPTPLFKVPFLPTYNLDHVDVSPDGDRFLVKVPTAGDGTGVIEVVLNWPTLLSGTGAR